MGILTGYEHSPIFQCIEKWIEQDLKLSIDDVSVVSVLRDHKEGLPYTAVDGKQWMTWIPLDTGSITLVMANGTTHTSKMNYKTSALYQE